MYTHNIALDDLMTWPPFYSLLQLNLMTIINFYHIAEFSSLPLILSIMIDLNHNLKYSLMNCHTDDEFSHNMNFHYNDEFSSPG